MLSRYFPKIDLPLISLWLAEIRLTETNPVVFVLLPESAKERVSVIQGLFNDIDLPLLGAIFPALVTDAGFATDGITLMCFPEGTRHFLVDALDTRPESAVSEIADGLSEGEATPDLPGQQLFLIFDSMLPNTGSLLIQLFQHLGRRFSYAGVCAGSESFQPMPCLFDNHRLLANGALGIVINPATHIAVHHGYPVSKSLMRASSTVLNRIDKLDGQPAMSVYQRMIADEFGIALTPENFYDYAVHYPFGLISSLEVLVRIPVGFTDDGSIYCVGEIPPSSMLRLLKAPSLSASHCVNTVVDHLGGPQKSSLIAFYCAGRRMHFGQEASDELEDLRLSSGSTAICGALSLGEIGTYSDLGIPAFHNAALVCIR